MIKYFVSTHRTQGQRDNDANNIPGTEIVALAGLSHEDDTYCSCARSFVNVTARRHTTTTAEIVESEMTPVQFVGRVHAGLVAAGLSDTPDLRADAANTATDLLRAAAVWPVGTVVERRGHQIRVRSFPTDS